LLEDDLGDVAWRPRGARGAAAALRAVDRVFDAVYGSRYNPLYRTGTLSALFLTIALVTGVYLLFVYELGRPYESVAAIQRDLLLGRWIRALHRYASDAALVAAALHVLRVFAQGKTWGPRTLAWITGVLLAGATLLSAFTGFVLVWDVFGQRLAVAGARMLRLIPIFVEPPDRAFVGDRPASSPFFFMNLFLHVAVPLGMVAFLWLHTSRLARAAWFPERKVVWGTLGAFVVLAVLWPAPLPPAADLLAVPGRIATDWPYGFWLPLAEWAPAAALATTALLGALLLSTPWLLRPRRARRPGPASVDPDRCEGCRQCFADCPYDAIQMVAGKHPERYPLRADVQADLCVSCGLCAASCASLAIGPPGRTATHQLADARALVASVAGAERTTLVVACRSDAGLDARLRAWCRARPDVALLEIDCAGTLHPGTVSYLATHFDGVLLVACPPQNCVHREGAVLADARILHEQRPAVPGRIRGQRVAVVHAAGGEWPRLRDALTAFVAGEAPATPRASRRRAAGAGVFTAVLLALVALGSRSPQGADAEHAVLRLGWRLAGQVKETCRDLTAEELARRPVHMRTPRECSAEALAYTLTAAVDGRVVAAKTVRAPGLRADRPLTVEEELPVAPGEHDVTVAFAPEGGGQAGRSLHLERRVRFERGRVALVAIEDGALAVLTGAVPGRP
jgi:ferredoxin